MGGLHLDVPDCCESFELRTHGHPLLFGHRHCEKEQRGVYSIPFVQIPHRPAVQRQMGVVACFSPLFYNERWQLIIPTLEIYRQVRKAKKSGKSLSVFADGSRSAGVLRAEYALGDLRLSSGLRETEHRQDRDVESTAIRSRTHVLSGVRSQRRSRMEESGGSTHRLLSSVQGSFFALYPLDLAVECSKQRSS